MLVWVVSSAGLCWMPSGWLVGVGAWFGSASDGPSGWGAFWREGRDYVAHGILMAGVGYSLVKALFCHPKSVDHAAEEDKRGPRFSLVNQGEGNREPKEALKLLAFGWWCSRGRGVFVVLLFVFFFAFLIEVGQALLPVSFQRGFSWGDLAASMIGGLAGCYPLLEDRSATRLMQRRREN